LERFAIVATMAQSPLKGYTFPPYYNYPPFWTLQTNPVSLKQQYQLWESFVTSFVRHLNKFELIVLEVLQTPLFYNSKINRRLTEMNVKAILDYMVTTGHAEWENEFHTRCRILWRTYAEWIDIFCAWAASTGRTNEIFTVFELLDTYEDQEFYKMDAGLAVAIFKAGHAMGKITFRERPVPTESGVKFVPPAK